MTTKKVVKTQTVKAEVEESVLTRLNAENVEKAAKQIWLAGLGAYGRSIDEIKSLSDKLNDEGKKALEESQKIFDELVARGEELQADTEKRIKEGKSDLEERIESRIEKLKDLAPASANSEIKDQLDDVSRKLDMLSKQVKKTS